MWNGTVEWHAQDTEQITVRLQKFNSNEKLGLNQVEKESILLAQGLDLNNIKDTWAVSRIFLSAHGNGVWFPTKFPGEKEESGATDEKRRKIVKRRKQKNKGGKEGQRSTSGQGHKDKEAQSRKYATGQNP